MSKKYGFGFDGSSGSANAVTGSGTVNRFAIFTGTNTIGDSSWENSSGSMRPITDNTYDIGDSTHYTRAHYNNITDYASTYIFKQFGTETARFSNTGNFGVGAAPTYRIHATTAQGVVGVAHTAGALTISTYVDSNRVYFGSLSNSDVSFWTGGSTSTFPLYIHHVNKSVGAGTSNPSSGTRIHAVGDRLSRSAMTGQVDNTSTTLGTGFPALEMVNADTTTNNWSYLVFSAAAGGSFFGSIALQHVNRASAYGDLYFGQRTSAGYLNMISMVQGKLGFGPNITPNSIVQIGAGGSAANSAPLQLTSGTSETTARAGLVQYSSASSSGIQTPSGSRFTVTESDTTERYVVQAATSVKTTAAAPYTNDGYISMVINGTTVKVMTTA